MVVRIVKMTFKEEKLSEFLAFLAQNKHKIREFPGCNMVEILQEKENPKVIMTHSHWDSEFDLENYRVSELFKYVWGNTKIHFSEKPEAWTLNSLDKL